MFNLEKFSQIAMTKRDARARFRKAHLLQVSSLHADMSNENLTKQYGEPKGLGESTKGTIWCMLIRL